MNASLFVALNAWSETWAANMLRACVQGSFFVMGVWLLCRFLPRLPAALRAWLWWFACLKMVLSFVPLSPMNLPVLPASSPAAVPSVSIVAEAAGPVPSAIARRDIRRSDVTPATADTLAPASVSHSPVVAAPIVFLLILWTIGLCGCVGSVARRTAKTYRLTRRAEPIREETTRTVAEEVGRALRLRRWPLLLASDAAAGPMIAGLPHPVIVLPRASLASLSVPELRMILTHEGMHLRRGDLWLLLLPTLTQTLFFFHPLVWLAAREYHLACETACDAETLRITGTDARDYGSMLLKIASSHHRAGASALGASSGYRILERRLKMLQRIAPISSRPRRALLVLLFGVSAVCIVPWRLSAQNAVGTDLPPTKQVARKADTAPASLAPAKAGVKPVRSGNVVGKASNDVSGSVKTIDTLDTDPFVVSVPAKKSLTLKPGGAGKAVLQTRDAQDVGNPFAALRSSQVKTLSQPPLPVRTDDGVTGNIGSSTGNGNGNGKEEQAIVRLDLGETTIFAALKALFHAANVSYRIDGDAAKIAKEGQVTISIVNVPFRTALEMIVNSSRALPTHLTYQFENGFYIIVPATSSSARPTALTTSIQPMGFATVSHIDVMPSSISLQPTFHMNYLPSYPSAKSLVTSGKAVAFGKVVVKENQPAAKTEDILKSHISLKAENADLRDVLRQLFEQARANYTLDPSIVGEKATVSLSDVPFQAALQALLRQSKKPLTYRIENNIVQVIPKE